ncbi:Transthyretin-like family protein [Caenorhabditis elegans]|uniref:Transthyretin-like family protein n=1 Tax=Caenorhabditis elegans TaxID=6239 RepID=Q8MPX6_CAEEL|nr:Transthyretin-like family protein [Caenorhabditis elegans]CCD63524.1 Transthyretin-like family protein [Caenorhabditis elegans]|eukprot:NP_741833.1 TransThyretin-Related family domain [Caenorhabditis elegans]
MLSSTSIVLFFATISCCSALLFGLIGSEQLLMCY